MSCAVFSTRGENDHAASSSAACAAASCSFERSRISTPLNSAAAAFVKPNVTPSAHAIALTAITRNVGAGPSRRTNGLFRSAGSERSTARKRKSGTRIAQNVIPVRGEPTSPNSARLLHPFLRLFFQFFLPIFWLLFLQRQQPRLKPHFFRGVLIGIHCEARYSFRGPVLAIQPINKVQFFMPLM